MRIGWEIMKAGDIFEMTDFVSNGSFASLRENVEYLDHPDYAVLVRLADYSNGFDSSRFVYVSKKSYEYLAKSKLYGGEIIMSNVGSVGKSFICPDLRCPMTIGPNAVLIRSKNNIFFQYYFQTEEFQKKLLSISSKATLLKFNKTNFKTLDIPVPPLPVQHRIVDFLDQEFAKIDALKANAEKSLQAAKDLFQATLKNELEPKEGWETRHLNEWATYSIGLTYKPTDVSNEGTIVLRSSNIQNSQLVLDDIVRVSCKVKDELFVEDGDILMCSRNGSARLVGKVARIGKEKERMTYGTFMTIIRSKYNPILFYYFKSKDFRSQIGKGENTMINQITKYMLNDVVLSLPNNPEEISRIACLLDDLNDKCKNLQDNYQKTLTLCDDLKQALLRKAFNGEL